MDDARALGRIEAKLDDICRRLDAVEHKIDRIERDLAADKADLQALKHRGVGIIVACGLVATAVGAKIQTLWSILK